VSQTPTFERPTILPSYEIGWVAIHRMLREGKSWSGREEHCVYLNTGDGRFANVSGCSGLDWPDDGRAAALVDWDLDGRQDVWISGRNSPRVRLFLNRAEPRAKWLQLRLVGTRGTTDALGARVEVRVAGEAPRIDSVRAGSGYLAESSRWLHFGLGEATAIERVVVRWPKRAGESDATLEEFEGVAPNGRFVLEEGAGRAVSVPRESRKLATAPSQPVPSTESARIVLTGRPPLPPAALTIPSGDASDLRNGTPRPLLVNVWASWCSPCIKELRDLAARREEIAATGLHVLALSADEVAARPTAIDVLSRVQWQDLAAFATPDALDALDALQQTALDRRRRMPLPISFLVDADGGVAVVYKGPVDIDVLLADVARLRASPTERRNASTPFPGRWIADPPSSPPLETLLHMYEERRLVAAADDISSRLMDLRKTSPARVLNEMGFALARQGRMEDALQRFREAARQAPDDAGIAFNLATALHELRRLPEAIETYKRVLVLDSRRSDALYNLALARCAQGDFKSADGDLAALALLDPQAAEKLRRQMESVFKR